MARSAQENGHSPGKRSREDGEAGQAGKRARPRSRSRERRPDGRADHRPSGRDDRDRAREPDRRDRNRDDKPREDRHRDDRPRYDRGRDDRSRGRDDRPRGRDDRPGDRRKPEPVKAEFDPDAAARAEAEARAAVRPPEVKQEEAKPAVDVRPALLHVYAMQSAPAMKEVHQCFCAVQPPSLEEYIKKRQEQAAADAKVRSCQLYVCCAPPECCLTTLV